jgi:NADH dehydrogenase
VRYELAGPQTLSHEAIVELVLRAAGRSRPLVHVPAPLVSRVLRLAETLLGARAPATPDEAELLEVSMTSARGAADAIALGVAPRTMSAVLGVPG